ncbi:baseplate J/gp47 family protein [Rhizobium leguminosarum]|uniref:baseplate J/gp47 family protein n=1 Tax=Rhizobium leguminosarum TaxID=384 RepID=UPI001C98800B|nr:baseplate J/gp47 family protein [Rhizobium leguminosarum]MBY5530185.1 hypothetical protein [Rhizobium leguminosarum]
MGAPVRAQIVDKFFDHKQVLDAAKLRLGTGHGLSAEDTSSISDPIIALADAWAVACDVLGFYQERMVNESYIGTAVEERSVFELARMAGYTPDQGLAAKCYLYYTIDTNLLHDVLIPAHSKIRAIPRPSEDPQIFETSKDLVARSSWNAIKAATSMDFDVDASVSKFYFIGTATGLDVGDLLCAKLGGRDIYFLVQGVEVDREANQTMTSVVRRSAEPLSSATKTKDNPPDQALLASQAADQAKIEQQSSEGYYQMQMMGRSWMEANTMTALERSSAEASQKKPVAVIGFRKRAMVFGHRAPQRLKNPRDPKAGGEPWGLDDADKDQFNVIDLEGHHPNIVQSSRLCIEIRDRSVHGEDLEVYQVFTVQLTSRTAYGMTGDITRLTLDRPWKSAVWPEQYEEVVQRVIIHLDELALPLGKKPIISIGNEPSKKKAGDKTVEGSPAVAVDAIELDGVYLGIEPGRLMILSGDPPKEAEPTQDREPELLTVKSVSHPPYPYGDASSPELRGKGVATRTILKFEDPLQYAYDPKTVKLYGNVVEATHGQTYSEVLGSGIGARQHQSFALARGPLTQLSVPTFPGAKPELSVTVDGEEWACVDTLARSVDGARAFSVWIDDTSTARVYFGNGDTGARLPTGRENVKASYRIGLGQAGNIASERLKLPVDHPLGVQGVSNTRASGGSDREPLDRIRSNTPLATVALDRLVTKADFLHMARVYPGVAKAKVRYTPVRGHAAVIVSIVRDGLASPESDIATCSAVQKAMTSHQDGAASIFVVPGILCPIAIGAVIKLRPGASWDDTSNAVRAALIDVFGFERRELAQSAHASEALAAVQSVRAVEFATLTKFQRYTPGPGAAEALQSRIDVSKPPCDTEGGLAGAELLLVQPNLPNAIVLEQDKS